jgi:hypothetical protein
LADDESSPGAAAPEETPVVSPADLAVAQIDDFINVNIAQIAPDYSNFVNNTQGFSDASAEVQLNLEGGLPSGFALSGGQTIAISPERWSDDSETSRDNEADGFSDFDGDSDSLQAEAVIGELRAGDIAQPQFDAPRAGSAATSATSSGAAAAATQPITAAAPIARASQTARPGRAGNIDQQQSTNVFDQLAGEVVIASVTISSAIAKVSNGQRAEITVTAFDVARFGTLTGRIQKIAGNTTQPSNGEAFYETYVEIIDGRFSGTKRLANLVSGMEVVVDIVGGKRTILDYVLMPFSRATSLVFREN